MPLPNLLWATSSPSSYSRNLAGVAITPLIDRETLGDFGTSIQNAKLDRLKTDAIVQLEGYGKFLPGWDGYRGQSFDEDLLRVMQGFVTKATRFAAQRGADVEDIVPGPASDGSVDLQFVRQGRRLTITLYPHALDAQTFREGDGSPYERTIPFEPAALVRELSWFLA